LWHKSRILLWNRRNRKAIAFFNDAIEFVNCYRFHERLSEIYNELYKKEDNIEYLKKSKFHLDEAYNLRSNSGFSININEYLENNSLQDYFTGMGKTYAYLIGLSNYKDKSFTNLDYTLNDIELMKTTIYQKFGKDDVEIFPIVDEYATRENILTELNKAKSFITENDKIVIYFSGHGTTAISGSNLDYGACNSGKLTEQFILPFDTDFDNITETAIPIGRIVELTDDFNLSEPPLLIVDACRNIVNPINNDVASLTIPEYKIENPTADLGNHFNYSSNIECYRDELCHGTFGFRTIVSDLNDEVEFEEVPIKVFDETGYGTLFDIICAAYDAVDDGTPTCPIGTTDSLKEQGLSKSGCVLGSLCPCLPFLTETTAASGGDLDVNQDCQCPLVCSNDFENLAAIISFGVAEEFSSYLNYDKDLPIIAAHGENVEGYSINKDCVTATGTSINAFFVTHALALELTKGTPVDDFSSLKALYDLKVKDDISASERLLYDRVNEFNLNEFDEYSIAKMNPEFSNNEAEKKYSCVNNGLNPKLILINATNINHRSAGIKSLGNGLFTYYLAKSLDDGYKDDVDFDSDGVITIKETLKYIDQQIYDLNIENLSQTPDIQMFYCN